MLGFPESLKTEMKSTLVGDEGHETEGYITYPSHLTPGSQMEGT